MQNDTYIKSQTEGGCGKPPPIYSSTTTALLSTSFVIIICLPQNNTIPVYSSPLSPFSHYKMEKNSNVSNLPWKNRFLEKTYCGIIWAHFDHLRSTYLSKGVYYLEHFARIFGKQERAQLIKNMLSRWVESIWGKLNVCPNIWAKCSNEYLLEYRNTTL